MRILVAIPHFYRQNPHSHLKSECSAPRVRAAALVQCLVSIHQSLGSGQQLIGAHQPSLNSGTRHDVEILLLTTGGHHLVGSLPPALQVRHVPVTCSPEQLGYQCHQLLRDELGNYDYYGYFEDDIQVGDGFFADKVAWFVKSCGSSKLLLPNRFELAPRGPVYKLYIDGRLSPRGATQRDQFRLAGPGRVSCAYLGGEVWFETADNPHAGCFLLNHEQMTAWAAKPYFMDLSDGFWGPLESAATLGVLRTFEIFKPAMRNAAFLEVRHLDPRHLIPISRHTAPILKNA